MEVIPPSHPKVRKFCYKKSPWKRWVPHIVNRSANSRQGDAILYRRCPIFLDTGGQGGTGERGRSWGKGARDCLLAFASDRNGGGAAHLVKCRRFYCPLPPLPAPPLIAVDTKHQPLNDGGTQVPAASFTWPRACESGDGNTRSQTRSLFARRNH